MSTEEKQDDSFRYVGLTVLAAILIFIVTAQNSEYHDIGKRPAYKRFANANAFAMEMFFPSGSPIVACGTVTKFRVSWMPKEYVANLTNSEDRTDHKFQTLAEAEDFLRVHGCMK